MLPNYNEDRYIEKTLHLLMAHYHDIVEKLFYIIRVASHPFDG